MERGREEIQFVPSVGGGNTGAGRIGIEQGRKLKVQHVFMLLICSPKNPAAVSQSIIR